MKRTTTLIVAALISALSFGCNKGGETVEKQSEGDSATQVAQAGETINQDGSTSPNKKMAKLEHLTTASFKQKVFDYEKNKDWKFEGDLPCIIDFYADWCAPCKMIAPILEELQVKYEGKIRVYKVNTEDEPELASAFGVRSIPSLLFCPMGGQPQMTTGALPKETFERAIDEVLLNTAEVK